MKYLVKSPKSKDELVSYYNFRWEMLRKPLGTNKNSSLDEYENDSFHIMAITNTKKIIGCGRVHLNKNKENQIRFMAVSHNYQRMGVGSNILINLENYISSNNQKTITLNAREEAVKFYLSMGYSKREMKTSEIAIPHIRMVKSLS